MDTGLLELNLKKYQRKYQLFQLCPCCSVHLTGPSVSTTSFASGQDQDQDREPGDDLRLGQCWGSRRVDIATSSLTPSNYTYPAH